MTTDISAKSCIAVLTRGYPTIEEYKTLIQRNVHIDQQLTNKQIPLLLFHEGNITLEQQIYIAKQTPLLQLQFINICENNLAFRKEKAQVPSYVQLAWAGLGYRHMCSFWFVDFWHFVQEYDYLIRLDEDCNIHVSLDKLFQDLQTQEEDPNVDVRRTVALGDDAVVGEARVVEASIQLLTAVYQKDEDFVTIDMNKFTRNFIHDETGDNNVPEKYPPNGPYTNFFGMNLNKLRTNERLHRYIQAVDKSDHIYHYRWGDLPLWGEAVSYILGDSAVKIDDQIRYYHGTHYREVNGNS